MTASICYQPINNCIRYIGKLYVVSIANSLSRLIHMSMMVRCLSIRDVGAIFIVQSFYKRPQQLFVFVYLFKFNAFYKFILFFFSYLKLLWVFTRMRPCHGAWIMQYLYRSCSFFQYIFATISLLSKALVI